MAITERLRSSPQQQDRAAPGALYPALYAATALMAFRLVLDEWLDRATHDVASPAVLREQVDEVIAELTAELDWPGTAYDSTVTAEAQWSP